MIAALNGGNRAELVHKDEFSAFEGTVQNRDLVQSYVPRYEPGTTVVNGVFEIYSDATAVVAEVSKRQWDMGFAVVGLLSALYAALFWVVKRAQDVITRQSKVHEEDLRAVRSSEERWKFALEGAGVWDRNLETGEAAFSERYKEIYGFTDNMMNWRKEPWTKRVHPDDLPAAVSDMDAHFAGNTKVSSNERRMQCADGSWKWVHSRGMIVERDESGVPKRMIGTHTDISERKKMEDQVRQMAFHDTLTGLPNRRMIDDRLSVAQAVGKRSGQSGAVMFMDMDNFKPLNDLHGHVVGDLLLVEVSRRLRRVVREMDTVGRFGGDEFVALVGGLSKDSAEAREQALAVAEKIRKALSDPYHLSVKRVGHTDAMIDHRCAGSIGVAMFSGTNISPEGLLKRADMAMYQAKESGRDAVAVYEEK